MKSKRIEKLKGIAKKCECINDSDLNLIIGYLNGIIAKSSKEKSNG